MRLLIVALVMTTLMLPGSVAQQPSEEAELGAITYFLIDASGSMKQRGKDAEVEISKRIDELVRSNPNASVSRTYFKAENRDVCWSRIIISEPTLASESHREILQYGDDYTPLGQALESAILQAGDRPADIFIVSDEIQTPNCGVDICEVARQYLPHEGITVRSISIAPDAVEHERLKCIELAQTTPKEAPSEVTGGDGESESDEVIATGKFSQGLRWFLRNSEVFIEKWFWLLGVIFVAGSASSIGFRESSRSRIYEDRTEQARSYQKQIGGGDTKAGDDLKQLIALADAEKSRDDTKGQGVSKVNGGTVARKKKGAFRTFLSLIPKYPIGFIGFGMLALLALLPKELFGFSIADTKDAAWAVFDSDFATAFAVTWIAIIFFAGTQHQRRREAEHNFGIVTREAERTEELEKSEVQKNTFTDYMFGRTAIRDLRFDELRTAAQRINDEDSALAIIEDVEIVTRTARDAALGRELKISDDLVEIGLESTRMNQLVRKPAFGWGTLDFSTFVGRLIEANAISKHQDEWKDLCSALGVGSSALINERVRKLATRIKDDQGEL